MDGTQYQGGHHTVHGPGRYGGHVFRAAQDEALHVDVRKRVSVLLEELLKVTVGFDRDEFAAARVVLEVGTGADADLEHSNHSLRSQARVLGDDLSHVGEQLPLVRCQNLGVLLRVVVRVNPGEEAATGFHTLLAKQETHDEKRKRDADAQIESEVFLRESAHVEGESHTVIDRHDDVLRTYVPLANKKEERKCKTNRHGVFCDFFLKRSPLACSALEGTLDGSA